MKKKVTFLEFLADPSSDKQISWLPTLILGLIGGIILGMIKVVKNHK
jgi:hypothetical protein